MRIRPVYASSKRGMHRIPNVSNPNTLRLFSSAFSTCSQQMHRSPFAPKHLDFVRCPKCKCIWTINNFRKILLRFHSLPAEHGISFDQRTQGHMRLSKWFGFVLFTISRYIFICFFRRKNKSFHIHENTEHSNQSEKREREKWIRKYKSVLLFLVNRKRNCQVSLQAWAHWAFNTLNAYKSFQLATKQLLSHSKCSSWNLIHIWVMLILVVLMPHAFMAHVNTRISCFSIPSIQISIQQDAIEYAKQNTTQYTFEISVEDIEVFERAHHLLTIHLIFFLNDVSIHY